MKKEFSFFRHAMQVCVVMSLFLMGGGNAKAQNESKFNYGYHVAKPYVQTPENVESDGGGLSSFDAKWDNIEKAYPDEGVWNEFTIAITQEYEAKENGVYEVANAEIKGATPATGLLNTGNGVFLDDYMSQYGWAGKGINVKPNAICLDAKNLLIQVPNADVREQFAILLSPYFDLSNNNGDFQVKFTAKVAEGQGDAELKIWTYGGLLVGEKIGTGSEIINIPNDGKEHEYTVNFKNGTWCQMFAIGVRSEHSIDFTKSIQVLQELKKGDKGFRTILTKNISQRKDPQNTEVLELTIDEKNPKNAQETVYSYPVKLYTKMLEEKALEAKGEHLAYRVAYKYIRNLGGEKTKGSLDQSLFSDPAYFTYKPESIENKYLYVGYCTQRKPDYSVSVPGSLSTTNSSMSYGAAIKATQSLLKDYVGLNVVGIRICTAASTQSTTGFKFKPTPWNMKKDVPAVFLASQLRNWKWEDANLQDDDHKTKYLGQTYTPTEFSDGWNTVFFKEPYKIKEGEEFYAGAYVEDQTMASGAFCLQKEVTEATKPGYTCIMALNFYGKQDLAFVPFKEEEGMEQALLLQLIIEPKDDEFNNKGSISELDLEPLYYDNELFIPSVKLTNEGVKPIENFEVKFSFAGQEKTATLTPKNPIAPSASARVDIDVIRKFAPVEESELKITLTKVNGSDVVPSVVTGKTKVLDNTKYYPRLSMYEYFTTESCKNCPTTSAFFFDKFDFDQFKKFKKKFVKVAHHTGNVGDDFLTIDYSKKVGQLAGTYEFGGQVYRYTISTPTIVIDRTYNELLDTRQNGSGKTNEKSGSLLGSMAAGKETFGKVVNFAAYRNPALAKITLTKKMFDEKTNKLTVDIEGEVSELIPADRPVYVSFILTQNALKAKRQENGSSIDANYIHHNAIRLVDDAGFQGTLVTVDGDRKFKMTKEISIKAAENLDNPGNNEILPLDENDEAVSLAKVMDNNVTVIAFLHYYTALPTDNDMEDKDPRFRKNEIINVAVSGMDAPTELFPPRTDVAVTSVERTNEVMFVDGGRVHMTTPYTKLHIFTMDGTSVMNKNLASGVYVVRATLENGKVITGKVIVR